MRLELQRLKRGVRSQNEHQPHAKDLFLNAKARYLRLKGLPPQTSTYNRMIS